MCVGFGEAVFYFQAAFFSTLIPAWALGLARCLNHFAGFVGFWFSGSVVKLLGTKRTLILGTGVRTLIKFICVGFASTYSPFIMGASNVLYGPGTTARGTLLQVEFSDEQRATTSSIVSLSGSLVFAFVSTALGVIADHFGAERAMLAGLSGSLVVIALYRMLFGQR